MRERAGSGDPSYLVNRTRNEDGIALPAALVLLFVIASVAAALMTSAMAANSQSGRDRGVKRAVAAADAGVDTALYRLNKLSPLPLECAVVDVTGVLQLSTGSGGWCPAQEEDLGDGARFSYRVSTGVNVNVNGQDLLQRKVVSTGIVNGVQRRVMTVVGSAVGGTSLFHGKGLISDKDLNMENNVIVTGNAASNGNISIKNNVQICGAATPGPGKQVTMLNNSTVCGSTAAATQPFVLSAVGDIPAADGNLRIGTLDPWTTPGGSIWNPVTKELTVQNNATLTLTGNVYRFCHLTLKNNAQLIIASRPADAAPVTIYIDSPENCPGVGDAGSVTLQNNAAILNTNSDPTTLQLYVKGSSTQSTVVEFKNNFDPAVYLALYAPNSNVVLENNTYLVGAVAAGQVYLKNNSRVTVDGRTGTIGVSASALRFERQRWTECTVKNPGATADAGC